MLLSETNRKTARIPVKFIDGKFINQITGKEVNEIKDKSYCEIVVEAHTVSDLDLLNLLMDEEAIELLPPETRLYACVSSKDIPENLLKYAIGENDKEKYVEIRLNAPLLLKFRGTKPPMLQDCECDIPFLKETNKDYEPAKSLNHAYRLISTAFEPNRRSFGGSVFLKILIPPQKDNSMWTRLCHLRESKINDYFDNLKEKYQKILMEKQSVSLFK